MKIGDKIWLLNTESMDIFTDIIDEQDCLVKWSRCGGIIIYYSEDEAKKSLKRRISSEILKHKKEILRLEELYND